MDYYVCSRQHVAKTTSKVGATHVLSLLDPGVRPFLHPRTDRKNWRLFLFEDCINETETNAPTKDTVENILAWGKGLPADAIVLVHCEAGVSRSTAAALALMVQERGREKIDECLDLLLERRPEACPNPLITKWADEILGCDGHLHAAAEEVASGKILRILNSPCVKAP
jgi:predicted protein tyrosine phosphatase